MTDKPTHRSPYPEAKCFDSGFLKVSDLHTVFYEQSGKSDGNPVIYLHGGPGSGTTPEARQFFDPESYRIVLMDQRGSGKSTPSAELRENTTWHLVEDIEKLRKHLGIEKWVVFGGSWGSTLALAYAETHPDSVKALVMRGIFMLRRCEDQWYYQDGASRLFPDYFEKFTDPIPLVERHDLIGAYYRRLTGDCEETKLKCAKAWSAWEMATSKLLVDPKMLSRTEDDKWALHFARIECHYFVNGGFMKSHEQLLDDVEKIRHIPATIVQGRYDVVCPMDSAWALHKRWPEAEFHIAVDSGHSAKEPTTMTLLLNATDKYRTI